MIIDIHTHTTHLSDDSDLSPDDLIVAAKEAGLDGVCITEHDRFWSDGEVESLSRSHDFPVFPGCEITTEEGHLLVYGLHEYRFGMHRSSYVRELADRAGASVILAHPYRRTHFEDMVQVDGAYEEMIGRAMRNPAMGLVDGLDVLNGRGSDAQNGFSMDLARRSGLARSGASDAHDLKDVGTYATEFERRIGGLDDLVEELRSGRFRSATVNGRREPG